MVKVLRWVALAMVVVLASPCAWAQEEDSGLFEQAGPLAVPVGWRTISQACKGIGFDAEQLSVARTLHQGYRASVKEAAGKGRKASDQLQKKMQGENPDWSTYQKDHQRITAEFVKELESAEKTLMTDLEAVCTPEQKARFGAVERALRRDRARVFTLAPGEALDPPGLLAVLKVERTREMNDAIAQWEETLDRIVVERERLIRKLMDRDRQDVDPEVMQKEMKEAFMEFRAIAQRIGDLNRRSVKELGSLLPADAASKLDKEVRVRIFPRIWGESKVTRAVRVAKGRADLTPEQKQKLDELVAAYEAEAEPINTRWAAAADDKFRTLTAEFLETMGRGAGEDEKEPFFAIRKERRALDEKYAEKVTALLNQDQRTAVANAEDKHEDNEHLPEFIPDIGKDFEGRVKEWKEEEGQTEP